MSRTHLITGVAGQDGIWLARHLSARGERVIGTVRPGSRTADTRATYLAGVEVVPLDVRDHVGFGELLEAHRPDTVFNLAGFTSVGQSWREPELVAEVNGTAVQRQLDAVLAHRDRCGQQVRFLQASSAEEHGAAADSPYAAAKAAATAATVRAREEHGLFACAATLFNHESALRGREFVTRKITRAAAEIALGRTGSVRLGNLEVSRDWGAAREYVTALPRMLALDEPTDLVLATGVVHALTDLLDVAFAAAGLDDPANYVHIDPALVRPADSTVLGADPDELARTAAVVGWSARTSFEDTVATMVEVDLLRVRTGVEESRDYLSVAAGVR